MSESVILFIGAILIVAGLLFAVISLGKKSPRSLDVEKYRSQWLAIEHQFKRDEVGSWQLSVLNADKLLDLALKERAYNGETMGERMKSAKPIWSNATNVWNAHKLRNQIAHETSLTIKYADARQALSGFKQGLKDLGAI